MRRLLVRENLHIMEEGPEVDLLSGDAEFLPDILPVFLHGCPGEIENPGDLLIG